MGVPGETLRFWPFEADPNTGELRKHGMRIKLPAQAFRVLLLLADKSGELVTRDDIRLALWPHETVVEWEHSINTAIKRIRAALGDSAETPRFVQTLPRRGYRFVEPVQRVSSGAARGSPDVTPLARAEASAAAAYTDPLGQTISHYRVLELLGAGGMGVVYRGEDTALQRPVALKFLRPSLHSDSSAVERFQREARSASSLNHSNICTIYEVEVCRGRAFLAMELLEGETLRERMTRALAESAAPSLFPSGVLLDVAIQVALALEAAHERGIIHRDIKPANIFLLDSEIVKVLDFGLAKAAPRRVPYGSTPAEPPTSDPLTDAGLTPGTIAYMSPEQKRGDELDARTDLYSLGAVLYEAACLERAPDQFNPAFLSPLHAASHPAKLWEIIGRLLDQDRAMRYQTAGDVASELKRLKRDISSSARYSAEAAQQVTAPPSEAPGALRPRRARKFVRIGVAVVVVLTAAMYFISRYRPEPALGPVLVQPLTGMSALEDDPAFAPDGTRVAYSAQTGPGFIAHIYLKLIGGGPPLALTSDPAYDTSPAWALDGKRLAFLRKGDFLPKVCLVPALGGSVQCRASIGAATPDRSSRALSWLPDGNALLVSDRIPERAPAAIYRLNLSTGEKARLTSPPPDADGDGSPSVAPDGTRFAFIRWMRDSVSDVYVEPVGGGTPLRLTSDNKRVNELAWAADSRSIVMSTRRGGLPGLWREASNGGSMQPLAGVGDDAAAPAISRVGNLAAYVYQFENVNLWRLPLTGAAGSLAKPALFIQSPRQDASAVYSPDGKRIAFSSDRSGSFEIWASDSDGSHPQQLTFFKGPNTGTPHWSPDGRWIVFDSRPGGHVAIFVMGSDGGQPRQITDGTFDDLVPFWSHDGRWIYFCSSRSGDRQIWRVAPSGLNPVQITRTGGFDSSESPDGKWLVYSKPAGGIWRAPVAGGAEENLVSVLTSRFWTLVGTDLIYLDIRAKPSPAFTALDLTTRHNRRLGFIAGDIAWGYSGAAVSPDGRWLLYPEMDRLVSQINLVENFR